MATDDVIPEMILETCRKGACRVVNHSESSLMIMLGVVGIVLWPVDLLLGAEID
jgi:hypothetical protein